MTLTLRPLTPNDQAFLWEMLYLAVFVPPDQPPLPRSILNDPEIAPYAANWGREHDAGFMALVDGQAVGAAWLRLFTQPQPGYGYVDDHTPELSIALLPSKRGMGTGTRLLQELLNYAQGRYPAVSLSVDGENPARHLYERLGFETVKRVGSSLTLCKKLLTNENA